jgi:hypothetical protein
VFSTQKKSMMHFSFFGWGLEVSKGEGSVFFY